MENPIRANPHGWRRKIVSKHWKQKDQRPRVHFEAGTSYKDAIFKGSSKTSIKVKQLGNEWLRRTVIAKLKPYRSMIYVQDHLRNLGYVDIEVKHMGGNKVIMTCKSIEERDALWGEGKFAWLKECFQDIQKWEENMTISNSRLVWLNFYGVPLHLWNMDTFMKLGSIWGDVILISEETVKGLSYAVGKVLISTDVMEIINQIVELENNKKSFQVRVIEEQMVINTFLKTDCNCSGCLVNDSLIQSQSKICDDDDEENSSRILAMDVGKIDNHLDIHNVEGENCNSKPVTDVHTPVDNVEVVEEVADTGLRERLLQVEKVVEETSSKC